MKPRPLLTILAAICMVVLALGYGAYQGWAGEYQGVQRCYPSLEKMIHTRVETAYNLLTVAGRHLPKEDELIKSIRSCRDVLEGENPLPAKAEANESLSREAAQLLEKLAALESVQQDERDLMYVQSLLPQMLSESQELTVEAAYNEAARTFNSRLQASAFSGRVAMLLGVDPAEEFIAR